MSFGVLFGSHFCLSWVFFFLPFRFLILKQCFIYLLYVSFCISNTAGSLFPPIALRKSWKHAQVFVNQDTQWRMRGRRKVTKEVLWEGARGVEVHLCHNSKTHVETWKCLKCNRGSLVWWSVQSRGRWGRRLNAEVKGAVCLVCASCPSYLKTTANRDDTGSRLKLLRGRE